MISRPSRPTGSARAARMTGVALLEVLISVVLLAVGVLGLIAVQSRAIGASVDAEDRNRAALLANDAASRMWLTRSATLSQADLADWQARVASPTDGGLPAGVGTITPVAGLPGSADVTIVWRSPARASGDADSRLTTRITVNLP